MKYFYYQIVIKGTDKKYIGSTKHYDIRIQKHKLNCIYNTQTKLYIEINKNGGWLATECSIIAELDFNTNSERFNHEQKLIDELGSGLNSKRAYISPEDKNHFKYLPIICRCGFITSKCNVSHHIKSRKCLKAVSSIVIEKCHIPNSISAVHETAICQ